MTHSAVARRETGEPAAFAPGIRSGDPVAHHWLAQVTLRLRREVCWLWRERSLQSADGIDAAALPPAVDRALAALDLARYEHEKRRFFADDATARHLSERIGAPQPAERDARRGSFAWVARHLQLAPCERFVLAAALLPVVDCAAGQVIAACLNDAARTAPSLALAQRLWDEPDELLRCFDPAHVLLRYGLIAFAPGATAAGWETPLTVPPLVARMLLGADAAHSDALQRVAPQSPSDALEGSAVARVAAALARGESGPQAGMRIVPVVGPSDAPLAAVAAACAERAGVPVVQPQHGLQREHLAALLAAAWLADAAVYLPASFLNADGPMHDASGGLPLPGLPITVFVGAQDRAALRGLGATRPPIVVAAPTHGERLACWRRALPAPELAAHLPELARRYRYGTAAIERVGAELATLGRLPGVHEIYSAARADVDLGALAQKVAPRFALRELMLPQKQTAQIDELVAAMRNLTRVHYEWGMARAWNESGLAALFAGPPGTGKTMAAEAIAAELDLPLYRIDLSQVVNKYIGETEKNLRQLFDAADSADVILFFDEADALFGKRTEVKDAHDRYANLEISYLLERMERFKGLAILATNRRKELDEAFLRRLRFVVEFPLPEAAERLRIWRSVVPAEVDASAIDCEFLAQRFPLAGGHIRAIVFQACLQSAEEGAARALTMAAVIRAVQREYEKLERASSLDQFGPYAQLIERQRSAR